MRSSCLNTHWALSKFRNIHQHTWLSSGCCWDLNFLSIRIRFLVALLALFPWALVPVSDGSTARRGRTLLQRRDLNLLGFCSLYSTDSLSLTFRRGSEVSPENQAQQKTTLWSALNHAIGSLSCPGPESAAWLQSFSIRYPQGVPRQKGYLARLLGC